MEPTVAQTVGRLACRHGDPGSILQEST